MALSAVVWRQHRCHVSDKWTYRHKSDNRSVSSIVLQCVLLINRRINSSRIMWKWVQYKQVSRNTLLSEVHSQCHCHRDTGSAGLPIKDYTGLIIPTITLFLDLLGSWNLKHVYRIYIQILQQMFSYIYALYCQSVTTTKVIHWQITDFINQQTQLSNAAILCHLFHTVSSL